MSTPTVLFFKNGRRLEVFQQNQRSFYSGRFSGEQGGCARDGREVGGSGFALGSDGGWGSCCGAGRGGGLDLSRLRGFIERWV